MVRVHMGGQYIDDRSIVPLFIHLLHLRGIGVEGHRECELLF